MKSSVNSSANARNSAKTNLDSANSRLSSANRSLSNVQKTESRAKSQSNKDTKALNSATKKLKKNKSVTLTSSEKKRIAWQGTQYERTKRQEENSCSEIQCRAKEEQFF